MELNDKTAIKSSLRKSYSSVIYAINDLDEVAYNTPRTEGKWSPGDILGHLILSTKGIIKAMQMPKTILSTQFGTHNGAEKTREALMDLYLQALNDGVKAPSSVIFRGVAEKGKDRMITTFTNDLDQLVKWIDNWTERELSKYLLPHPAFGKLTVREMLYFTELHNYHHLKQIEKALMAV